MSATDNLKSLQIRANLIADRMLCLLEIRAYVQDGVAHLSGEVETGDQKAFAEELAYQATGVYDVVNEISVVPDSLKTMLRCTLERDGLNCQEIPAENEASQLELELKSKLASAFHNISVSVSCHHIACVDGNVSSEEERMQLQNIVLHTNGVAGMDSNIHIASI